MLVHTYAFIRRRIEINPLKIICKTSCIVNERPRAKKRESFEKNAGALHKDFAMHRHCLPVKNKNVKAETGIFHWTYSATIHFRASTHNESSSISETLEFKWVVTSTKTMSFECLRLYVILCCTKLNAAKRAQFQIQNVLSTGWHNVCRPKTIDPNEPLGLVTYVVDKEAVGQKWQGSVYIKVESSVIYARSAASESPRFTSPPRVHKH